MAILERSWADWLRVRGTQSRQPDAGRPYAEECNAPSTKRWSGSCPKQKSVPRNYFVRISREPRSGHRSLLKRETIDGSDLAAIAGMAVRHAKQVQIWAQAAAMAPVGADGVGRLPSPAYDRRRASIARSDGSEAAGADPRAPRRRGTRTKPAALTMLGHGTAREGRSLPCLLFVGVAPARGGAAAAAGPARHTLRTECRRTGCGLGNCHRDRGARGAEDL